MTQQERIKADAKSAADDLKIKCDGDVIYKVGYEEGHIAGATAEHAQNESVRLQLEAQDSNVEILLSQKKELIDKSQVLVDALEVISESNCDYESTSIAGKLHKPDCKACRAKEALEQWKGKEVEPVKEIEYMPIHPDDARKFDCPTHFPMHLLDEGQAQRNHSQTLKRLKERGGLSVREILAIVGKKPWSYYSKMPWDEAIKMLNDIVITNPQK